MASKQTKSLYALNFYGCNSDSSFMDKIQVNEIGKWWFTQQFKNKYSSHSSGCLLKLFYANIYVTTKIAGKSILPC